MGEMVRAVKAAVVIAAAGLIAAAALGLIQGADVLGVVSGAVAYAVLQNIRVPAPSGAVDRLGIAAIVAMPLITSDWAVIVSAYAIGMVVSGIGVLVFSSERSKRLTQLLAETVGLAAFLSVVRAVSAVGSSFDRGDWEALAALAAGAFVWFVLRSLMRALLDGGTQDHSIRYQWLLALEDWPVALSMFTAGALFGYAWTEMRWWAFPVAILPYAFGHLAFVRYHGTRITYGQTIRALAQIPEVAGLAPKGHATRTAGLAVAVGRDIGMHPDEIFDLEYASLMHDIGRITLNEPAILMAGYTDEDIARWGSQIIAEAPYLSDVAELVAQQCRDYRSPGVVRDEDVPLVSRIIKVTSAYDEARHEMQLDAIDAMERLHRGSAYEYDPEIVASLRRVLTRNGELVAA